MYTRGKSRLIPKSLLILSQLALVYLLGGCGQDPSFTTSEAAIAKNGANGSAADQIADRKGESTICDPDDVQCRQKQAEHCQEEGIADEDCFKYGLVTMKGEQPSPGAVDILWVVDVSGSMTEEQSYLGNNFDMFINRLVDSEIDFQVALTTTDVCQDTVPAALEEVRCPGTNGGGYRPRGDFIGTPGNKVLKESTPNLISTFKTIANVGITGSGFEHGLKAADLAIHKTLSGQNEPLIRDNSFLAVIVVSDEEDDGIGLSMKDGANGPNYWELGQTKFKFTDDNLIDYLKLAKGDGQYSISAITGTIDPATNKLCTSPHSQPIEVGTQYISAAQKTGGIIQSICETSWDTALSNIGADLNAQITQIMLDYPAKADTIQVKVNGQSETHWVYIPASNAVKFDLDHIPSAGAKIELEYLTKL